MNSFEESHIEISCFCCLAQTENVLPADKIPNFVQIGLNQSSPSPNILKTPLAARNKDKWQDKLGLLIATYRQLIAWMLR